MACKTYTEKTASCMMDFSLHWLQLNLSQRVFINCWPQAKDYTEYWYKGGLDSVRRGFGENISSDE